VCGVRLLGPRSEGSGNDLEALEAGELIFSPYSYFSSLDFIAPSRFHGNL